MLADSDDAIGAVDSDIFVILSVAELGHGGFLCSTAVVGMRMEGESGDARGERLAAHDESDGRPRRSVRRFNESHRDWGADARAEAARGDDANQRALGRHNPRPFARRGAAVGPEADAQPSGPVRKRVPDASGARKSALRAPSLLDRPGEIGFNRIHRFVEFVSVETKTRLEPQGIARAEADRRHVWLSQQQARK